MTIEEAIECVTRNWSRHGACVSCGWYGELYEYPNLAELLVIREEDRRIELNCLSDSDDSDTHAGIRIPFGPQGQGLRVM